MNSLSTKEQNRIKLILYTCIAVGIVLIVMAYVRRERAVDSVHSLPIDETNNQVRESGNYVVEY